MPLQYQITEDEHKKTLTSVGYNYVYNKDIGILISWGRTKEENPVWCPFGPTYAIIDVTNMSMELFTVIIDTLNANRTITTFNLLGLVEPSDGYKIQYCLDKGIVPRWDRNLETEEEAGFFSVYVDSTGIVRPVSSYSEGIDILSVDNMYNDLWQSTLMKTYRYKKLQERACKDIGTEQ